VSERRRERIGSRLGVSADSAMGGESRFLPIAIPIFLLTLAGGRTARSEESFTRSLCGQVKFGSPGLHLTGLRCNVRSQS